MSQVPKKLDEEIRRTARNRCGYCLGAQRHILAWLEIEHLLPRSKGGKTLAKNLWLACTYCNTFKGSQTHGIDPKTNKSVSLFNPRTQSWQKHFEFASDRITILGKTICGRATVKALNLNHELALTTRMLWVEVGWYPPSIDDLTSD